MQHHAVTTLVRYSSLLLYIAVIMPLSKVIEMFLETFHSITESVSWSVGISVSQPVIQSVSRSENMSASQPASQPISQSVSQSESETLTCPFIFLWVNLLNRILTCRACVFIVKMKYAFLRILGC